MNKCNNWQTKNKEDLGESREGCFATQRLAWDPDNRESNKISTVRCWWSEEELWGGGNSWRALPVPREMPQTVFVQAVCAWVGVHVLKNRDHGFLCHCAVGSSTFHFLWNESCNLFKYSSSLTWKKGNKGVATKRKSPLGNAACKFLSGGVGSLSPAVTQDCQFKSQEGEGGLQSPAGPFYILREEANHFTRVSRHPTASDGAVMIAMITVIILFCLQ